MLQLWPIYALLSAAFAAGVAILAKKGFINSTIDTTLATTIRAIVMSIFLISISFILGKTKLLGTINSRTLLFVILSGISGAISWLFYFVALNYAPVNRITAVAALDRFSIVFVAIFAITFFGESMSAYSITGIFLVLVGTILMTIK